MINRQTARNCPGLTEIAVRDLLKCLSRTYRNHCPGLTETRNWVGQSSGQTSYEGIAAQIEAAAQDPSVRGVALEIDSFGGEVAGVFDLADRIRTLRSPKPVWAFVAAHAFSAGYALASQADRSLLPPPGLLAVSALW